MSLIVSFIYDISGGGFCLVTTPFDYFPVTCGLNQEADAKNICVSVSATRFKMILNHIRATSVFMATIVTFCISQCQFYRLRIHYLLYKVALTIL